MIAAWALYAILVAALLTLAAALAAVGLRLYRRAVRWAWAAAIAGSVLWPLAALAGFAGVGPWRGGSVIGRLLSAGRSGAAIELPTAGVIEAPGARAWLEISALLPSAANTAFVLAWGLASAILLGIFMRSWRELQRRRSTWTPARIAGTDVLLSRRTGPAVMGLLRSTIVLPSWVRDLRPDRRELVVVHELEHLRAGDSRLLGITFLVVALVPWNPLLWLQLHRLRLAVELDCDRRVIRGGTGPGRYGRFLVNVSGGTPNLPLPATGLAESTSFLERRLRAMTRTEPRLRHVRALSVLLAAGGALALACDTPVPTRDADVAADEAVSDATDAETARAPDASPLVFVDGVRVSVGEGPLRPGTGALTDLSPEEIERIEVVKGEAARALYGDEGADGVIRITTRRGG